jgi:SAM-dependent methyltransferase
MADGFTFDFDGGCEAPEPATLAPDMLPPVPSHPLAFTPLAELLTTHASSTQGRLFAELFLEPSNTGIADIDRHSVMHVTGARDTELQSCAMSTSPAAGAEDGDGEAVAAGGGGFGDGLRDIVPGQYLGGLKVWSCAVDLARAVFTAGASKNIPAVAPVGASPDLQLYVALRHAMSGHETKVLELGCGHGLPGLVALACGATDVTFHDFNHQVIEACLLPNLVATFGDNLKRLLVGRRPHLLTFNPNAVVRAGSGAWANFGPADPDTAEPILFDAVLGADITYDDEATEQAVQTIARVLKPGGHAFIGTKVYYFGTGGGVSAVQQQVDRWAGHLDVVLDVPVHSEGDSMPRRIVVIRKR